MEAVRARGRRPCGQARSTAFGAASRQRRGARARAARQRAPAALKTHRPQGAPARHRSSSIRPTTRCMAASVREGLHCSAWDHLAKPGAKPARRRQRRALGRRFYMAIQMEAGHLLPDHHDQRGGAGAAAASPTIAAASGCRKILSRDYDPSFTAGRRQARRHHRHGHDGEAGRHRRARQHHDGRAGRRRRPRRRVPASPATSGSCRRRCRDAFLVLAQAPGGLSCFLMPRFLPDGSVNALRFQRLKDKLGNRSNASSEVEFHGAHALADRRGGPRRRRPSSRW